MHGSCQKMKWALTFIVIHQQVANLERVITQRVALLLYVAQVIIVINGSVFQKLNPVTRVNILKISF
jgi:hypothetical protein